MGDDPASRDLTAPLAPMSGFTLLCAPPDSPDHRASAVSPSEEVAAVRGEPGAVSDAGHAGRAIDVEFCFLRHGAQAAARVDDGSNIHTRGGPSPLRLTQAAERSLNGRRRSSGVWIAGGT